MQARLAVRFQGVVLHAGHEGRRPKLVAAETITFVEAVQTGSPRKTEAIAADTAGTSLIGFAQCSATAEDVPAGTSRRGLNSTQPILRTKSQAKTMRAIRADASKFSVNRFLVTASDVPVAVSAPAHPPPTPPIPNVVSECSSTDGAPIA
jgi:hypothetical protein